MRLKIWLHRLRDIRIKAFRKRRVAASSIHRCNANGTPKRPISRCGSPLSAGGKFSRLYPDITGLHVPPGNCTGTVDIAACTISPRLGLSPLSPLPSPALRNTPVSYLKSPLTSSLRSPTSDKCKPSNTIARVVASFGVGCGGRPHIVSSFGKTTKDRQELYNDLSKKHVISDDMTLEGSPRGSRGKWIGACCMLVKVENGLIRTTVVLKKRRQGQSAIFLAAPKFDVSNRNSGAGSSISNESEFVKGRKKVDPAAKNYDALDSTKSTGSKSRLSNSYGNAKLDPRSSSSLWSKEQSSVTSDENFFSSFHRPRPSECSISSSEAFDKNFRWASHDGQARTGQESVLHGWQLDDGNLEGVGKCTSLCPSRKKALKSFCTRSTYSQTESSEEDRLLQADSCAGDSPNRRSTSDLSASSCSPWLQSNRAVSRSSVHLEANAKAWAEHGASWVSKTLHNESIKHAMSVQKMKAKKEDTSVIRRKYWKAYGQPLTGQGTIVLPREIITKSESGAAPMDPSIVQIADAKELKQQLLSGAHQGRLVEDSLAVEKCSQDPYGDFRDSMVDMILEKQLYKSVDLEELLQCFLSLNSLEHHDIIVQAFTEVWEKVFGGSVRSPLCSSLQ